MDNDERVIEQEEKMTLPEWLVLGFSLVAMIACVTFSIWQDKTADVTQFETVATLVGTEEDPAGNTVLRFKLEDGKRITKKERDPRHTFDKYIGKKYMIRGESLDRSILPDKSKIISFVETK